MSLGTPIWRRVKSALAVARDIGAYHRRVSTLDRKIRKRMQQRDSIGEVMAFIRDKGFRPGTIFDIGVNTGTPGLYDDFPDAKYVLVDPLEENAVFMKELCERVSDGHYFLAAAAATAGEVEMSVAPSFGGSGMAKVYAHKDGSRRRVPALTLDDLAAKVGAKPPYLLKIDTEGAELEVLEGAQAVLAKTELLILEVRLRPIGNAPQLQETLAYLKTRGFVAYDFIDRNYHDRDRTLKQLDLVAVKEEGFFRTHRKYRALSGSVTVDIKDIHASKLTQRKQALEKLELGKEPTRGKDADPAS